MVEIFLYSFQLKFWGMTVITGTSETLTHALCTFSFFWKTKPTPFFSFQLNLNSLLVKRKIYNPSPGAVTEGKLVPSSHKRGELRHTII